MSCCNKAKYGGDTTTIGEGLSNLLGAGPAAEGLGISTACSKLDGPSMGYPSEPFNAM
ncbi:hypothetical protein BJX68DRAFT_240077 [Aspergillus pseudodeflectus]|uniref:Uncharacterized protein n=1 Tax=Aspergillus pseudodeflectus TaxID=176178 RepID=A0ABR4K878_9EURO